MSEDPMETRVTALEKDNVSIHQHLQRHDERLDVHEERITVHGRENDELRDKLTRAEVEDHHRDEAIQRIESKLDTQSGKVDSIIMQPAQKWSDMTRAIISAVIGAVVTAIVGGVIVAVKMAG